MTDNILDALEHLDAAECDYEEWVEVGMALKREGYSADIWDSWSRSDPRYRDGECGRKWAGFGELPDGVTGGTIIHIAEQHGYKRKDDGFEWDDIFSADDIRITQAQIQQRKKTEKPLTFNEQCEQIKAYLNALFQEDEHVGYCTASMQRDDGKWTPCSVGTYGLTAGALIGKLNKVQRKAKNGEQTGLDEAIGAYKTEAGAWIRFNPLDGQGVNDANITAYRYALVESDTVSLDEQESIIRALNLPVAALVSSGGKSIHAIVHIDALDKAEYKRRVDELYAVCEEHGLKIDKQNKNPSRLSRMPGIPRGEKWQRLIDTHIGAADWQAWREWLNARRDDLPDPVPMSELLSEPIILAPEIIGGILRQGHKMILSGDSKSGKSFAMIELAIALTEGTKWFGKYNCKRSKVLYLNFEIDPPSFSKRCQDVYDKLGINPKHREDFLVQNLRGHAMPMDELTPSLINKALKFGVETIILDPIYKVLSGDENSASDMAKFVNNFDRICNETGCSFIYAHHHTKGEQSYKAAQDRMSGSGVFARDPDAIIDLMNLNPTDDQRDEAGVSESAVALEVSFTLRDFASPKPSYMWFDYPIHFEDPNLKNAPKSIQEKATEGWAEAKKANRAKELSKLDSAFNWCQAMGVKITIKAMTNRINEMTKADYSTDAVRKWIDKSGVYFRDNGEVSRLENL